MSTTPHIKFALLLPLMVLFGVLGSTAALGQFPDSEESPFKEDAGAFSEMAEENLDAEQGSARARARARARRRMEGDSDRASTERRTIRPRSERFNDEGPFRRPSEDLDEESSQKTILNDRYAGWREASDGLGDRRIGEGLRSNWVMVGPTGVLQGTVRPIDGAEVPGMTVYLMNKGRLVKTAAVQGDGSFSFNNVRRGAYSLVGWGDKAFFAFGANVLGYSEDADESTPTYITTYAFQNTTTINTDWIRYFTPNVSYRIYGRHIEGEGPDDPEQLFGVEGLSDYQPEAIASTSVGGTPVSLTSDGRLIGRVHQMRSSDGRPIDVRSTKVMLLKRDSVVASTTTDNYGVFEFEQVPPGGYGLLAAGVDGVGLTGLEVVSGDSMEINDEGELADSGEGGEPFDFCLTTAETAGWLNHYAIEVDYQRSILAPRPPEPSKRPWGTGDIPTANTAARVAPARCHCPDLSFGEWQQLGCACYSSKRLDLAKRVLRITDRIDQAFERTFYPESASNGISGGYGQQSVGYGQGGYRQAYGVQAPYSGGYVAPGGTSPRQPIGASFSDMPGATSRSLP